MREIRESGSVRGEESNLLTYSTARQSPGVPSTVEGSNMNGFCETNPIVSFCVLREVYCEKEVEKTKPIC